MFGREPPVLQEFLEIRALRVRKVTEVPMDQEVHRVQEVIR